VGTLRGHSSSGFAVGVMLAALAAPATAAPASAPAQSKAIVLRPLSFFRVQDMNLGDIIPGTAGGTVRLLPNGTRTSTGTVVLVGSTHQPARFAGLGTPNELISVTVSPASVSLTGPGAPMLLTLIEIGSTPTAILSATPTFFRIGSALGNYNFPVGATLAVGANQAEGVYSGTFTMTLNYL
jgi:Domain of unknown function (DUF4402)